jgi:hypothetical protein
LIVRRFVARPSQRVTVDELNRPVRHEKSTRLGDGHCGTNPNRFDGLAVLWRSDREGQAAIRRFATTVTIQRTGELDASSFTELTTPVIGEPSTISVVFSTRY